MSWFRFLFRFVAFLRCTAAVILAVFLLFVFLLFAFEFPVRWQISITQVTHVYFLIDMIFCVVLSRGLCFLLAIWCLSSGTFVAV